MGSKPRSRWERGAAFALAILFASPVPAQQPPTALPIGVDEIVWYRAPARCAFATPETYAAFRFAEPETWRFRFLVMTGATVPDGAPAFEHAYVMMEGALRELEKVRSGENGEGAVVTVWRSAVEPRVNVSTTLRREATGEGRETWSGTLAMIRGNGTQETAITGFCRT